MLPDVKGFNERRDTKRITRCQITKRTMVVLSTISTSMIVMTVIDMMFLMMIIPSSAEFGGPTLCTHGREAFRIFRGFYSLDQYG